MLQMKLIIRGKVQKVGFRYGVAHFVGKEFPRVRGLVRNLPDGSVEVIAQGDIEELKSIHRFTTKGPPGAEVREVTQDISEIDDYTFEGFDLIS